MAQQNAIPSLGEKNRISSRTTADRPPFRTFAWRAISLQILTYFICGVFFGFFVFDYRQAFETTDLRYLMLPTTSPRIALGPALQVLRGLMFALVLYPFAGEFLRRRNGGLLLWGLFLGLAIFGTCGPSPGSFEGLLYTKLPFGIHIFGLPEVVLQTLLFCLGLVWWCRKPARWKNVVSGVGVGLIVLMSVAGFLAALQHRT